MAKQIVYGDEARSKLVEGIDAVANAVKVTLGPAARTVVLEKSWGSPTIINDGVTIAKDIELEDAFANMGAKLIQEVASKTQDNAGDGTSTASVMTQALVHQGMRNVTAGASPVALKSGFDAAIAAVVEHLKGSAIEVDSGDMIRQVATIAANNDPEIGALIAEAFDKVGREGVITVEDSKSMETELEVVDGMEFDKGYVSPYMVTDQERREAVLEAPLVLMTDQSINSTQELIPVLEYAMQQKRPLLIVAKDVEGQALATLVINVASKVLKACVVKAPGFGDEQGEMLDDIAILTGGQVISEEVGLKLENATLDLLGRARKVVVTKDETTIVEGAGDAEQIQGRVNQIRTEIDNSDSDYDREKLQERLAKLAGGVAVIKVGAATEVELKERKHRIEDAVRNAKAAVEEGIVPGGGVALIQAMKAADSKIDALGLVDEQAVGANIVRLSVSAPLKQIAENAGLEGGVVVEKVRELPAGEGLNAANGEYVDMVAQGIIDPAKVTRSALQNAASIAGLFLTTEAVVVDKPEPASAMPAGGGDMGGMDF